MKLMCAISLSCLMLSGCFPTTEEKVLSVVSAYESALESYDSKKTIVYLHPECIASQYGSEQKYHALMEKAFKAIQNDGGIVSTEKVEINIYEGKATLRSIIKTQEHQQEGILELKKHEGKWLISKLP